MSTVYNKKYFTDLLEKLVLPLKEHYSEECANLYLGHTGAAFEDRTIPMAVSYTHLDVYKRQG